MFIDTHMHEMTYSKDSFLKLDEMVRIGKEKGIGGAERGRGQLSLRPSAETGGL